MNADHSPHGPRCRHHLTRRRACGLAAGAFALAGCLGGPSDEAGPTPEPVAFPDDARCAVCGMLVSDSYGPNGQTFFDGAYPDDGDRPAYYDSVRELFVDRFGQAERGADPLVSYVTDYAAIDVETVRKGDTTHVTGSTDRSSLIGTAEAVFVLNSDAAGNMGADAFPFSDREAAEAFVETHGGTIVDEITRDAFEAD